ncbi:heme-binding protein [Paraburkholderia bonniea]|uniref:GlcG/HbpS family heme-binding protein n=1 Tax=Paraburkholderia bonniea TaxID=2152891 RepID=UPI002572540C|nr:heme-binding protein [Paraburkholderia bonniea]WJF89381.1 heme-binding protein [Paraburkholderia bonniea]WJF92696.1 heme-binding protein [Paraburkholderia bonniea]
MRMPLSSFCRPTPTSLAAASLLALALMASSSAHAQSLLLKQSSISLDGANRLIKAAMAECQAKGRNIVVSVLDRGGNLVAMQRADNVGPHNTEASRRKAFTALSTKSDTLQFATSARNNPDASNLTSMPELLLLGGGIPLKAHQEVVGAIGVAGGGGAAQDRACALAALAAVPELDPND